MFDATSNRHFFSPTTVPILPSQQLHGRRRSPLPFEDTNEPTETSHSQETGNGGGSNVEQARPAWRRQRAMKRDTTATRYGASHHLRHCSPPYTETNGVGVKPAPHHREHHADDPLTDADAHRLPSLTCPRTPDGQDDFAFSSTTVLAPSRPPCVNCGITESPLWRCDPDGNTVCNACAVEEAVHPREKLSHGGETRPKTSRSHTDFG
ncbi:hypothetical protein BDZ97DRAFT_868431 [Flammula alnicola]|nr:hypothetical protein BDZ97DRAFT_868431 [Flammula alnicola]